MGIMNFIKNPNKRIRLDLQNNFDINVGNDDLWGAEDITAEEFDMLEVQATQETSNSSSFRQPFPPPAVNNVSQVIVPQQQQYELEGKVKILSDSLEKLKKDLLEEKLNREKIINEKVQEYKKNEKILQKEIEKCGSALQFKEQEMKTVYDKVHALEMQLTEKKTSKESSTAKSPPNFLEKFNFEVESSQSSRLSRHQKVISRRKHRLCIDTPQGKSQGCNIVSSMLCNKLPLVQNPCVPTLPLSQTSAEFSSIYYFQLSAMSITRITMEQETNEIFHYFYSILKQFFTYLQNFTDKSTTKPNSPVSVRKNDLDKTTVISCLKDLSFILSCPNFSGVVNKLNVENETMENDEKDMIVHMDVDNAIPFCDLKSKNHINKTQSLLELLFKLAIPDSYPNEYLKHEEVEWSLAALVSWSLADIKNVLNSFNEQIILSHVNKCYSITASYIVLKLMIQLSTHEEYLPKIIHNNDTCHLCSVAVLLLRKISTCPLECITLIKMVIDYLSAIFTMHTFSDIRLESSSCIGAVLQGLLCVLQKYCKVKEEPYEIDLILQKGFTLLHYLSRYIPNFKERRKACDDLFISLVWEMLAMSKENPLFKDFYELAHELWDFQDDMSEFDVEDPGDDSVAGVDTSSQNES